MRRRSVKAMTGAEIPGFQHDQMDHQRALRVLNVLITDPSDPPPPALVPRILASWWRWVIIAGDAKAPEYARAVLAQQERDRLASGNRAARRSARRPRK